MVKMEVLYPEYMNLYGDNGNIKYLQTIIPKLKIIYTHLNDQPAFSKEKIDILYLGPTTEKQQAIVAAKLKPYREGIKALIDNYTLILATGNAIELFGKYIEKPDGKLISCLGLYNVYAKRFSRLRYNDNVISPLKNFTVVGFKNQLSHLYGRDRHALISPQEKKYINFIIDKNLFATYLLGPVLILNPLLTENLLTNAKIPFQKPPFHELAITAYQRRVIEFNK